VKLAIALLLFGLVTTALPRSAGVRQVKHAPTVAQCQADERLWMSKLEQTQPKPSGTRDVSYKVLQSWIDEMGDCEAVDPDESNRYINVTHETLSEIAIRYRNFLWRHNLEDQFIQEDESGKGRS
jgi:hypothetical protein